MLGTIPHALRCAQRTTAIAQTGQMMLRTLVKRKSGLGLLLS